MIAKSHRSTSIIVAALLLIFATNCSKKETTSGEPKTEVQMAAGSEGRLLNFNNLSEPEYLDPGLASGNVEHNIIMALFEGLVEYDPKDSSKMVPAVAEKWTVSADGKKITFSLRKNAKWNDGHPVTAHDFVYAWERALNPETASKYAFALYYVKNGKDYNTGKIKDPKLLGIKAKDDTTFEVEMVGPTPFFIQSMGYATFRPVPKWAIEKHGSRWTRPENIVTNGPFVLKTWVPQKEIVVTKSATYWDAANVKGAGIRFLPIEDKETALKMYENGEVDVDWEVPAIKRSSLMSHPDYVQASFLSTYFYKVNTTRPALKDIRVRRALAMAIDRKSLCDQYLQKTEIPFASMVPAGLPGYIPANGPDFNPEEAKKLFKEAGFENPSAFPQMTIHYNTDDQHKLIAQVIQQMWKKYLGINVQLHNEEWKSYLKAQNSMDFQISRAGWIGDYPDPNTFLDLFTSESTINQTGWKNAQFDTFIDQASKTANAKERLALLKKAETLLLQETPVLPIFTYKKHMMVKPYVKGVYPTMQDLHPFKWVYIE